ncbi:MAG TPA: TIGR03619 family F420-dependent LLM class oxidoreductase [Acidimicrobiia bacterium]|jgi:probable F420-dependent oxidoreductase|nr:TIGR03619 family F420-dependent LLM class oxidoreductase [Acidimicrobiia bacterium]
MRFGIVTPVLTRLPRAHARWEAEAGIDEVTRIVVGAEQLGYEFATCSEHVAVPKDVAPVRGATYWDPLATFGYLAAHTDRIRLATFVLVLGYHHPLAIAKRYGTLDRLCRGRLVLGVGVGSLAEEFALLDAPFADRGRRGDDAIRALRAAFGVPEPRYAGSHYTFADFVVDPCGVQPRVPIWVGGRTARSLRRAVELGDAWAPFALEPDAVAGLLQAAAATPAWRERDEALDVVLQPTRPLDPLDDPGPTADAVEAHRRAGATSLAVRVRHRSPAHYLEQLEALLPLA